MRKKIRRGAILLLSTTLVLGASSSLFAESPTDIQGHWAEKQMENWMNKHWIKGYPDGSFKPNHTISRAEFVTLVNKVFEFTEKSDGNFADISTDGWYAEEVSKARAVGYISGFRDGTFKPMEPISRQETAAIIVRLKGLNVDNQLNLPYVDEIPEWSGGAIHAVTKAGYMKGYPGGIFKPNQALTRAEAVSLLDLVRPETKKRQTFYYDKSGTYGPKTGMEKVDGDVVLSRPGVTLQNLVILGDLTVEDTVGNGEVYLQNISVEGKTNIYGGGEKSIHINNSSLGHVQVNKEKEKIRLVATGTTTVSHLDILSPTEIVEQDIQGDGFTSIRISEKVPAGSTIILRGTFESIEVDAKDITIEIPHGSYVNSFTTHSSIKVAGSGVIEKAYVYENGVRFQTRPKEVILGNNITLGSWGSSGGSSGGGSSNSTKPWKDEPAFVLTNTLKGSINVGKADELRIYHKGVALGTDGQYPIQENGSFVFSIEGTAPYTVYEIKLFKNGIEVPSSSILVVRTL